MTTLRRCLLSVRPSVCATVCAAVLAAGAGTTSGAETLLTNMSYAGECFKAANRRNEQPTVLELRRGIDTCSDALEIQALSAKDRAATLTNRGLLLTRLGDFADAMDDHQAAIAILPESGSIRINLANTQAAAGKYQDAFRNLQQAIDIADESLPIAHYNRALLFQRLGDPAAARADAEAAAELAPEQRGYRAFAEQFRQTTKSRP